MEPPSRCRLLVVAPGRMRLVGRRRSGEPIALAEGDPVITGERLDHLVMFRDALRGRVEHGGTVQCVVVECLIRIKRSASDAGAEVVRCQRAVR